jgi:gas vesicle protein
MNDWLKTLAPLLGTALGGPLGGAAAAFLADKLGLETKTVEAVTEVLNSGKMTPDQISQIKLAEIDFKKWAGDHDIKILELENDNVEGARKMREATHSYFPEILSTIITVGFFAILVSMTRDKTLVESAPLMIMLGSLAAAFGGVINFWLGSNKGSDRTKELLAQASLK